MWLAGPARLALWSGLVVLLPTSAGCTPGGVTVSTGPEATTIKGRFAGEPRGDAGCAWLETTAGEQIEVAYPNGWRIEFDPLVLSDDADRLRARSGDWLTVKGYFQEVGASICQPQRMFVATEVAASGPPARFEELSSSDQAAQPGT
jgi:hypothetical protein